jgi:hypothetical protein
MSAQMMIKYIGLMVKTAKYSGEVLEVGGRGRGKDFHAKI